jgi:AraC family transcriptional regulator of arabinose operon
MLQKKDGFKGQNAIILPLYIKNELKKNQITRLLHITDIGYYPEAKYHYRERPLGAKENILIFCVAGRGWLEINNIKKKVEKDEFFIIPEKVPHSYGADNSNPWTIFWVHFNGEIAHTLLMKNCIVYNISSAENSRNDNRISLFKEIYQTLSMGFSTENLEFSSVCLWYLLGSFQYNLHFERVVHIKQNDMVEKSIIYMQNHLHEKINLEELADQAGYSISQFSLLFKKKTTRSPIDYYNNLKIQNACQMLDFSDMKIKEIASTLCFEDQFYFSGYSGK